MHRYFLTAGGTLHHPPCPVLHGAPLGQEIWSEALWSLYFDLELDRPPPAVGRLVRIGLVLFDHGDTEFSLRTACIRCVQRDAIAAGWKRQRREK